jgi:hypothetical protein
MGITSRVGSARASVSRKKGINGKELWELKGAVASARIANSLIVLVLGMSAEEGLQERVHIISHLRGQYKQKLKEARRHEK